MDWTRRRFVRTAGNAVLLTPWVALGCGGDDAPTDTADAASTSSGTSGAPSSSGPADASTGQGGTGGQTSSGAAASSSSDATTSSEGSGGESSSEETGAEVCTPTADDIEGPFYRPEIPIGGDLDVHGDAGIALVLSGRVRDSSCTPLAGAVVEIWHATPRAPDGRPGDVNATYDETDAYRYYGQVATDERGAFTFETLQPGWYLNGNAYRPAHIHVKVWVRGVERLTTQLYFDGDPFNAEDPWFNPDLALAPDGAGNASIELVV